MIGIGMLAGCAATPRESPLAGEKEKPVVPSPQKSQSFEATVTKTVGCHYLVYLPEGYGKGGQRWPLILFLHGSGERGTDLEKVKLHGPPKLVEAGESFPFIIVSPQCPESEDWSVDVLTALLDHVEREYPVDTDRVYLTGLSRGGFGTWVLGMAHPERFAAIAPICGWADPKKACALKDVPVWAFHGAKDKAVALEDEEAVVDALRKCGGDVKFTIYPDATHDAWTRTYENPALYEWFLSRRVSDRAKTGGTR